MGFVGAYLDEPHGLRSRESRWRIRGATNHGRRAARVGLVRPIRLSAQTAGAHPLEHNCGLCRITRRHGGACILGGPGLVHNDWTASSSSVAAVFGPACGPSAGLGYSFLFAVLDASGRFFGAAAQAEMDDRGALFHYVRHDDTLSFMVFGRRIGFGVVLVVLDAVGDGVFGSAHSAGNRCTERQDKLINRDHCPTETSSNLSTAR